MSAERGWRKRDADVLQRRDARMRQSAHERQHTRRGGSHSHENESDQATATQNPVNAQLEVAVEHAKKADAGIPEDD